MKAYLVSLNLSISRRKDVFAMADWLKAELESLGATVEKRPLGKQMLDGVELDLPPALLGQLGNDPKKVCYVSSRGLAVPSCLSRYSRRS